MKWSEQAWKQVDCIFEKIIQMPFNQELMEGTLDVEKFKFYIGQDAIYLGAFSRALALIAARINNNAVALHFIRFAEGAVVVEAALHENYFKKYRMPAMISASPSCQLYTQFLLTEAALDQVEVAIAAVLPCFWIYKKVGDYIFSHKHKNNNPFIDWINTYSGVAFSRVVEEAIHICDEVATSCSIQQQQSMTDAFITACRLEWMFWDSAWKMEQWPV